MKKSKKNISSNETATKKILHQRKSNKYNNLKGNTQFLFLCNPPNSDALPLSFLIFQNICKKIALFLPGSNNCF